jgi:hypothetical protein
MSDLLNKASLVVIPSGYKEDTVYSVVPSDGSGDLSFTRASNGTRINSAGLVEVTPWNFIEQSSNLGSWSTAGVTITTGITDAYGTTNAVTMSNISSGSNTDYIAEFNNPMDLPVGTVINTSVYLKGSGSIGVALERGNTGDYFFTSQIFTLTSAWVRYDFAYTMPSGTRNGIHFYVTNLTGTTATSVDICFPQINYGSTAKPYFPTTDRLNVPRLTYQNGGGGCPSLLLEKQSTNLALYSEDFTNAVYTKRNSTISANATTSPDGTTNADKIQEDTSNDRHDIYQAWACTNGVTYTQTIFAKQGERRYCFMSFGTAILNASDTFFDLQDGVVVSSPSGVTSAIQNMGNGWYRCSITTTCSGNGTGYYVNGPAITSSNYIYQGVSGYGIYIWGCQIENSSYPTSYIPTTSASATRVADVCSKTGISSLIGQTEGVIFVDWNYENKPDSNGSIPLVINGSAGEAYIFVTGGGTLLGELYNSGLQASITGSIGAVGRKKIAFAYKQNDFALYMNGVQIGTDTSGTVGSMTGVTVGGYYSPSYAANSGISQAILFKTRLSNSDLIALTTI